MKHLRAQIFVVALISFAGGFMLHALFFPYLFSEKQLDQTVKDVVYVKDNTTKPTPADQENDLITYVNYSSGRFHPDTVTIHQSSYVAITNREKNDPMWLSSHTSFLNTKRAYIFGERLQTMIQTPGTYLVINTLNPEARLTIIVK